MFGSGLGHLHSCRSCFLPLSGTNPERWFMIRDSRFWGGVVWGGVQLAISVVIVVSCVYLFCAGCLVVWLECPAVCASLECVLHHGAFTIWACIWWCGHRIGGCCLSTVLHCVKIQMGSSGVFVLWVAIGRLDPVPTGCFVLARGRVFRSTRV